MNLVVDDAIEVILTAKDKQGKEIPYHFRLVEHERRSPYGQEDAFMYHTPFLVLIILFTFMSMVANCIQKV